MSEHALVTAADISRLAGVTRATVSNWRRRHADFPAPIGGTDTSPAYDLDAVRAWLARSGRLPQNAPADELRVMLRARPDAGRAVPAVFPVLLAIAGLRDDELASLADSSDDELDSWSQSAVAELADTVPGAAGAADRRADASLVRTIVRVVRTDGAETAADVLSERLLEDSSIAGTYLTPAPLAELMAGLLAGLSGDFPKRVLDPACGGGSLLAAAARAGAIDLYGQDMVTGQTAQAAVRLRLGTPAANVTVRAGDSLRADAFPGLLVDAVLCNPPYGDRGWGHDELAYDERWAYGVPPKGESELAWVQHCLSHLEPGAPAVLLMPPAVAERASGRRIRAQLVRDGALRAVIALPQGAATPLHIGLHLWILRRPGPNDDSPETVLFVDAATNRPTIDWADIGATISTAWHAYRAGQDIAAVSGARVVPLIDLLDQAVDVTPVRHVRGPHTAVRPAELAQRAADLRGSLRRAAAELGELEQIGEWPPAADRPRNWRTATVADLLRGGALDLLTASPRRTRHQDPEPATGSEHGARPVLTAQDVAEGRAASGSPADLMADKATHLVEPGDVLIPEVFRTETVTVARVAETGDGGCVLGPHLWLFRPDPQRLDPWFLAGFLAAEENVNAATTGTSIVRVDPRRLRVPLLPLAEQRRYGEAFRHLHALRTTARRATQTADEVSRVLNAGLTGGALLPPGHESP